MILVVQGSPLPVSGGSSALRTIMWGNGSKDQGCAHFCGNDNRSFCRNRSRSRQHQNLVATTSSSTTSYFVCCRLSSSLRTSCDYHAPRTLGKAATVQRSPTSNGNKSLAILDRSLSVVSPPCYAGYPILREPNPNFAFMNQEHGRRGLRRITTVFVASFPS